VTYVVTEACVDLLDGSCLSVCPVDCLYPGERSMYINPAECVDCGACELACPVEAIYHEDDLPHNLKIWTAINAEVFEAGPSIARDHRHVSALGLRSDVTDRFPEFGTESDVPG
jgi:NAD-dependent dihydropyrimidine dehydrogenase PreA subunit